MNDLPANRPDRLIYLAGLGTTSVGDAETGEPSSTRSFIAKLLQAFIRFRPWR